MGRRGHSFVAGSHKKKNVLSPLLLFSSLLFSSFQLFVLYPTVNTLDFYLFDQTVLVSISRPFVLVFSPSRSPASTSFPTPLLLSLPLQTCLVMAPNNLKYNIPTLMALCQDPEVACNWTGHAKECQYCIVGFMLVIEILRCKV